MQKGYWVGLLGYIYSIMITKNVQICDLILPYTNVLYGAFRVSVEKNTSVLGKIKSLDTRISSTSKYTSYKAIYKIKRPEILYYI